MINKFEVEFSPTNEDFLEVQDIERDFLKEETIATADQTFAWSKKNPDIEIFIRNTESGKIIGSLTIVPLNESQYNKFITGTLQDTELDEEALEQYKDNSKYWMLFSAISVSKEYHGSVEVLKMMFKGFAQKMKKLKSRGISFINICGEGQTPAGQRLLGQVIGLKKIGGDFEFPIYHMGEGDQSKEAQKFIDKVIKKYAGEEK